LAGRTIRNLDFATLVLINKEVVSLTGEKHEYEDDDETRIKSLVEEIASRYNEETLKEALIKKSSLLVYRISSGQHFHEGNKRTALVAASAFLKMNGRSIDIRDKRLLSVVDRAGTGTATLNEIEAEIRRLTKE
jgi:prophage maintenance system killer protein